MEFIGSGKIIKEGWPKVRNKKMYWGNTALKISFEYEEGHILTSKGNKVPVFKLIENSLVTELFDITTGEAISKPAPYYEQFHFDLSYNCFGYCFADSLVFLPNPDLLIEDDYDKTTYENAELILFLEHKGFGNNGEEIFLYSHAVKKLPNGNVSFKPGINKLVENVNEEQAIHVYNFNHKIYLKRK